MGFGQNALIFCLFLSIVLYVSGAPRPFEHDILSTFYTIDGNTIGLSPAAANALPQNPQSNAPSVSNGGGSSGWSIIDGLGLAWKTIKLFLNVLTMPIGLLTVIGLPAELVMMLAIPVSFVMIIGIIALVRGTFSW